MSDKGSQGPGFIHLRVRSAYSLLAGALPIQRLAALAVSDDMPALGIADCGNLFGALEFSVKMTGEGIQPIIGCTLAIESEEADWGAADNSGAGHSSVNGKAGFHQNLPEIVLIASNGAGYQNLMWLSSESYLGSEEVTQPRITSQQLEDHQEGLIVLTGGPDGLVDMALRTGDRELARARLKSLNEVFGDRLYVELQRHGLDFERNTEAELIVLAYEMGIALVATNDCHFPGDADFEAHDALMCISGGHLVSNANRPRLTPEHRFKTRSEMIALFADLPEATANSVEIAKRCNIWPKPADPMLPRFGEGAESGEYSEAAELRQQALAGLEARLEIHPLAEGYSREDYFERLEFEIGVIENMHYSGYFLIVADFIKWAKEQDIPVGPGRGSGAGSVVAWALTITDLDPLRFDLLFERFLNPERVSMPDFDIDFCQDRRDEVIAYVRDRYGADQVAQIITFGTLQSRIVLRDVGRVLDMRYGEIDALCKMVPSNPANPVSLAEAIQGEARLQEARDNDPGVAKLMDISLRLEGLYRHASTHAAGLVIGDRPLREIVPLYRDPRSPMPVTQYSMKWVEAAGLVKFDFLGLKTLTVIDKVVKLLAKRGVQVDIENLALDDKESYEMLARGETVGVFQLESAGMRDLAKQTLPSVFEDIIALIALYRPGPMQNIPKYKACKLGLEKPEFLHETIVPVTADTYGVIIYQEQVMQIAQVFAGYTLGDADLLRRAMGKKIKAEMRAQRSRFVDGAVARGVHKDRAEYVFELVDRFAGYGFNKSHSACYALVAYQTAYLKAHYPVEFLAASMTLDLNNTDKLNDFRQEAERLEIDVLLPNVNASEVEFRPENGSIRYSLAAVKNVGKAAVEHIAETREGGGTFTSLADFASRINPRLINRRAFENMAAAGAFDDLEPNRAALVQGADLVLGVASRSSENRSLGQEDMFAGRGAAEKIDLPPYELMLPAEQLNQEFDALGLFLSGHPLNDYLPSLELRGVRTWQDFSEAMERGESSARMAGMVVYRKERRTPKGEKYAFVGFSDTSGQFELGVFSEVLQSSRELLEPGNLLLLSVSVSERDGEKRLTMARVTSLKDGREAKLKSVRLYVDESIDLDSLARRLPESGSGEISLVLLTGDKQLEAEICMPGKYLLTPETAGALKALPGVSEVKSG